MRAILKTREKDMNLSKKLPFNYVATSQERIKEINNDYYERKKTDLTAADFIKDENKDDMYHLITTKKGIGKILENQTDSLLYHASIIMSNKHRNEKNKNDTEFETKLKENGIKWRSFIFQLMDLPKEILKTISLSGNEVLDTNKLLKNYAEFYYKSHKKA